MLATTRTKTTATQTGRRIVLIDIENVVGGQVHTLDQALWAKEKLENSGLFSSCDHIVLGVGPAGYVNVGVAWPQARKVVRDGSDGADLALLEILTTENLSDRFDDVVVISGDHIFAEAVALTAKSANVTVACWSASLSPQLFLASPTIHFLDEGFEYAMAA
ncbi:NYN domain-containing protein [Flaviflexus massiliensis]|uniref:NYN domain-containing protein n=1 Tax=Flaviflexus massiliensis TaxID=1522309 RepID=UPI0006D5B59D|nr:NYN domain-containing protein [Flaviflexus massiliensis]